MNKRDYYEVLGVGKDASADELEKAGKDLSDKIMPIGAKMYEASQSDASAETEKPKAESKDDGGDEPIEGEVVDPPADSGQDDKDAKKET